MKISPDVIIKTTAKPGTVYYFVMPKFSSPEPHFFIVLTEPDANGHNIIMVCSSSQIHKVRQRCIALSQETLVELSPKDYVGFTKQSIIDCNNVFNVNVNSLINIIQNNISIKPNMPNEALSKIVKGILKSPVVANELKDILRQQHQ